MCKGLVNRKRYNPAAGCPLVLKFWATLQTATPKLCNVPYLNFDITLTLLSVIFFYGLRVLVLDPMMTGIFGFPSDEELTYRSISSTVSMFHSIHLVLGVTFILITQPLVPSESMSVGPQWCKDASHGILQFCSGYMIYDSLISYIARSYVPGEGFMLTGDEVNYLIHHFVSLTFMLIVRKIEAGHICTFIIIFFGEGTNPSMNFKMICDNARLLNCCGVEKLQNLETVNKLVFSALYFFIRLPLASVVLPFFTYDLLFTDKGRKNVPLFYALYFNISFYAVNFGSLPYVLKCWEDLKDAFGPI